MNPSERKKVFQKHKYTWKCLEMSGCGNEIYAGSQLNKNSNKYNTCVEANEL